MTVRVCYATLPAERVFNLASPRYLPEIGPVGWRGKRPWHDSRYEPLRDLIERTYVDQFNAVSGHYCHLEASIRAEGFRNPIVVAAGFLQRRRPVEVPPALRGPGLIACEYLGGSRLWVAQRLGLDVPCIVNDASRAVDGEVLANAEAVLSKFMDKPRSLRMNGNGVYLNNLPYVHLPESERYGLQQQSRIRRKIIGRIRTVVRRWLRAND